MIPQFSNILIMKLLYCYKTHMKPQEYTYNNKLIINYTIFFFFFIINLLDFEFYLI